MNHAILQGSGRKSRMGQIDAKPSVADTEGIMIEEFEKLEFEEEAGAEPIDAGTAADIAYESKRDDGLCDELDARDKEIRHNQGGYPGGPVAEVERPRSPIFEAAAEITRSYALTAVAEAKDSLWVPDAGGNGIDALPIHKPSIVEYGKVLTKAEILRITNEFREALSAPTEVSEELNALTLVDQDELTKEQMKRAGEIRQIFKKMRVDTEHRRKFLKEKALRTGQMIDSLASASKTYCSKHEAMAEAIEKVEERREAARKTKLAEEREREIAPFIESINAFDLGSMSEEQYQILLTGSKAAYAARQQEIRDRERADAEREAAEQRKSEAVAKQIARVNQLSAAGFQYDGLSGYYMLDEFGVSEVDVNGGYTDEEFANRLADVSGVINARRAAAEEQARIEREAAQKAQAELDRIEREKAEDARKAAALAVAPDKEKLGAWFSAIERVSSDPPTTSGAEAQAYVFRVEQEIKNTLAAARDWLEAYN